MSVLIEKIIDKYSPFIGKKELNNIELNKKLISNNNQFNHFLHQHNVFIHINSNITLILLLIIVFIFNILINFK